MKVPPNYGPRYTEGFEQIFAELAARKKLAVRAVFPGQGGAAPGLMQADGLHPTARAQPLMLDAVWPTLEVAAAEALNPAHLAPKTSRGPE
jgi:acyl-CoA thioesterase I